MTRRRVWSGLVATLALLVTGASSVSAQQATIMGRVTDDAGTPLASVQVLVTHQITGAQRGTYTNDDGRYMIRGLRPSGPYRIEASRIGFGTDFIQVAGFDAATTQEFNFSLGNEAVSVGAIAVFAERAEERLTPVAYSTVDDIQIKRQLASRDLPLVLNTKPSVYATEGGGGAGDARINVRGFSQRNVAVMINGVPVNDMENGWVYWSNWDGVGDFTESIQLQRGLSAVNLATTSIGGTLNLITDPTTLGTDVFVKQEFGDAGFLKTTAMASSGLINEKFAIMAAGIRKTGDGIVQGAWTDAWAYYGAASWIINNKNRLDLYATGAPQRHGQRLYMQNIGAFDAGYARDLDGYDPAALDRYNKPTQLNSGGGLLYNENVSAVSCDYDGQQAVGDDTFDRFDCGFLNERENFYHKPQVNLNWFSQLNETMKLSTVAYYSGGQGGGTGTLGSLVWNYDGPSRVVNWDATIERNRNNDDGARGILRNSRNNQWTFGGISKLDVQFGTPLTVQFGIDARIAEIEHYREVRDLLGGDYWLSNADAFNPGFQAGLGDKVDYNFTNDVRWVGFHTQAQYFSGPTSVYGMVGVAGVKYKHTNHFRMDAGGDELTFEADWQPAYQVKGGALYNLTDELSLFANGGYVQRMPIFDQVIHDEDGESRFVENPKNQKFLSAEAGGRYQSLDVPLQVSANVYLTQWLDRAQTRSFFSEEDNEDYYFTLTGIAQRHMGVEVEVGYQPVDAFRLDAAASLNDWEYTSDAQGTFRTEGLTNDFRYDVYVDGLKVGNAPQVQFAYYGTIFPIDGAYFQLVGKTFLKHYSEYSPFDRTDPNDRTQPWQVPDYTVFDLHAGYSVPASVTRGLEIELFANVFNVLDSTYIMDALDNSPYNSFDQDHDADDAEVFFGLPRRFTVGASVRY